MHIKPFLAALRVLFCTLVLCLAFVVVMCPLVLALGLDPKVYVTLGWHWIYLCGVVLALRRVLTPPAHIRAELAKIRALTRHPAMDELEDEAVWTRFLHTIDFADLVTLMRIPGNRLSDRVYRRLSSEVAGLLREDVASQACGAVLLTRGTYIRCLRAARRKQ